jgi:hypothetical protein
MVHRGGGLKRMEHEPFGALLRDLADHFKPLREHLCDRADTKGIDLFWDAIEAIRVQSGAPGADVAAGGDRT